MSRSALTSKFKKDINILIRAVEGQCDLEIDYPKVYRKIIRFYESSGVQFYDDSVDNYGLVLDCLAEDLEYAGVLA